MVANGVPLIEVGIQPIGLENSDVDDFTVYVLEQNVAEVLAHVHLTTEATVMNLVDITEEVFDNLTPGWKHHWMMLPYSALKSMNQPFEPVRQTETQ
ncbi:MAG: hypothetical protein Q8P54_01215 [bacterium]|nr:hypothetical protein [bacterium]